MDDGYFETLLQCRPQDFLGLSNWRLEIRSSEMFTQTKVISEFANEGLNKAIDFGVYVEQRAWKIIFSSERRRGYQADSLTKNLGEGVPPRPGNLLSKIFLEVL